MKTIVTVLLGTALSSPLAFAQAQPQPKLLPAPTELGSNGYIDMYFTDWHTAKARTAGAISEQDVFTKGDPMKPAAKGAVLRYVDSYVHMSVAAGGSTPSKTLSGKQEVYYFLSGAGTLTAGGESIPVAENTAVLMPANLAFTLKNTGAAPLTAYVITEPTPAGFQPKSKPVVKDASGLPISTTQAEWSEIIRPVFTAHDGLATITNVQIISQDALTITRPYVGKSTTREDLWVEMSGTNIVFIGAWLRRLPPGMAYEHPPDNQAPTSNVNYSEETESRLLLVSTEGK
jgi:mannose-6-phosphate isomerase-like protein (cupin superfamily)